jgi:hypothetical protein
MSYTITDLQSMNQWRQFAVIALRKFHPSYMMALFLGALYFSISATQYTPVINWIHERIYLGTGLSIPAQAWQVTFLVGSITIAFFRPEPKYTFTLSLPAGVLGGCILWYGFSTGELPSTVMTFTVFGYLALGMVMVMMVTLAQQIQENTLLIETLRTLKDEQRDYATTDTPL